MKMENSKWIILKDIPIDGGKSFIPAGKVITVTNNVVYLEGGLLTPEWQEDFRNLILNDGFGQHKYIRRYNDIVGKSLINGKGF